MQSQVNNWTKTRGEQSELLPLIKVEKMHKENPLSKCRTWRSTFRGLPEVHAEGHLLCVVTSALAAAVPLLDGFLPRYLPQ